MLRHEILHAGITSIDNIDIVLGINTDTELTIAKLRSASLPQELSQRKC